jgi:phenylalanine ammonia-lyase
MKGSQEPFQPYLHDASRPHPGQIEAAANIAHVLRGSQLARVRHEESDPEATLRQDRYCLRAVPQWLGPQLEDIMSAQKTIDIELNSTTDNPLVDVPNEYLWHGANFMAMAVTSAMEKTRLALHHVAKLMFAQLTDILNHTMNCGLPPNLAVGEPSVDYSLKGADIAGAAYLSGQL